MSPRERVLAAVRDALDGRARAALPGDFEGRRPDQATQGSPVDAFAALFQAAGGEVVRLPGIAEAAAWIRRTAAAFASACVGAGVPRELRPPLPVAAPDVAAVGVSLARGAVAETGSLLLGAEDGRRAQLLTPVHVVFVREADVHATLRAALTALRQDLPSAVGLHSGPSKSADIGQVMVRGVHGPGRVIAVVLRPSVTQGDGAAQQWTHALSRPNLPSR